MPQVPILGGGFRLLSLAFCLWFGAVIAQPSQIVNGRVSARGGAPLSGANVLIISADSTYSSASDAEGRFSVAVAPGRFVLQTSFTGYATDKQELLVVAGKSNWVSIELAEAAVALDDISIAANGWRATPGQYNLTIEKTMRVPANFFDPARMATGLPGVVSANDQGNAIAIKGYSPNAMLWRLQGLDIVNPNHLANAGTLSDKPASTGGGVSILSSQVLDQTHFVSGSMPIEYGNALSGVMDLSLRPGSKGSHEHTVQASLVGIDLATEGPFRKKSKEADGSYLVNYRYSTVGLLSLAGINFGDEKINFQDITLHLDFNPSKNHHLSVFGFGGLSSNSFNRKPEADWKFEKDRYNIDFAGKSYGIGLVDQFNILPNTRIKMGVAASGQHQFREAYSASVSIPHLKNDEFEASKALFSGVLQLNSSLSPAFEWGLGLQLSRQHNSIHAVYEFSNPSVAGNNLDGSFNTWLAQPFIEAQWQLNKFWKVHGGLRYAWLSKPNNGVLEPRLSVARAFNRGAWSVHYGITSQINQPHTILASDFKVGLIKAQQVSMKYATSFSNGISWATEGYWHQLNQVPVALGATPFSTLNQWEDWRVAPLQANGRGRNYGLETMVEKKFQSKVYFQISGAVYRSEFKLPGGDYALTRFSGNFTSALAGGKEWQRANKAFGVHLRTLYLGGLRQPSIDNAQSQAQGQTVYERLTDNNFRLSNYLRFDVRVSWRKNKPGYTRTLSLDIQNVTNQGNPGFYYFDTHTQQVELKNQLGLIPVLVYRIDF